MKNDGLKHQEEGFLKDLFILQSTSIFILDFDHSP
jgi:hypothetical protein